MSCDIIIVSFNAAKFLKKCILSIQKYTNLPYTIIIVDNNSKQETKDYLKSLESDVIKICYNKKNYGFGYANNQGFEIGNSEYVCFLNSDTIVTENWLERLIETFENNKNAGIVGPTSNYVSSEQQKVKFKYFQQLNDEDDSKIQKFSNELYLKNKGEVLISNRLVGFCFLTKRKIINEVGYFDDRYEIGNFEDDDLCIRMLERGHKLYCAKDVFIYHYGGCSFEEEFKDKTPDKILATNQGLYEEKWFNSDRIKEIYAEKRPLKIVYLLASNGPSGGVKVVFEHCNRLKARGHDVKIICAINEVKNLWFNVKVPIIYDSDFKNIPEADIVIGTYFSTLPFLQNVKAKVKFHLCQGYEAHLHEDKIVLQTIKENYQLNQNKIVVSKWLKKIIDDEYKFNCQYVGNGIDQFIFSFSEHKTGNYRPRILVTGDDTLTIKGINFALDAIRDLVVTKKIELVRLSGSAKKITDLECEFHQMSLMTQDEIAKVYESCDITISASKKVEGFSLHPLESMASGTPVITTDCGGVIDYAINQSNSLVVPAEDSKAIRKSLDLLLENKALYNKFVQQGIKTSRQWLWFRQIDKLEKIFYDSYFKALKEETESLSVCMIVKNEEQYLEQCLVSIKPIASEIIIVDTGSTDGTIQIAKKFGARIYHYEWNDDFSAARNFSLSKATQAWTLVLDADEKIAEKDLSKMRQLLKEKKVYFIETRNYIDDNEVEKVIVCNNAYDEDKDHYGWCTSTKIRLFPTDKRIQFKGKVHELVEESVHSVGLNDDIAQFQVLHFGYLDKKAREERNNTYAKLGKEKLKENENDIQAIYELAVQYSALNNYDEALVLWRKAIQLSPNNYEFLARMGTTYNLLEDYIQAEKYFKKSLKLRENEYAYRHLGITYAKLNNYQQAYECLKKIIMVTKDLKAIGDYAFCCNYLKKFDESILILEKILRIRKDLVLSWGLLEIAYNEKGIELAQNHKYQQAALMFQSSVSANPKFEAARRNLAEVTRMIKIEHSNLQTNQN